MLAPMSVPSTGIPPRGRAAASTAAALALCALACQPTVDEPPIAEGSTTAEPTGSTSSEPTGTTTGADGSSGAGSSGGPVTSVSLLIEDVRIVDGTGRPPVLGAVLVDGDRIVDVVPGEAPAVEADEVIDGGGRTLVPGYVHLLTHISARSAVSPDPFAHMDPVQQLADDLHEVVVELADDQPARLQIYREVLAAALRGGVTTFVDSISSIDDLDALRPGLDDASYPALLSLGPILSPTGHHPPALDGTAWKHELPIELPFDAWEAELRADLEGWLLDHDLAGVKVAIDSTEPGATGMVPPEAVAAICEVAHAHERPCFFLAYTEEGLLAAAAAGADAKLGAPLVVSQFSFGPASAEALDALAAADVAFLSTVSAMGGGMQRYVTDPSRLEREPHSMYPALPASTHEAYASLVAAFAGVAGAPPDWMDPLSAYYHGTGMFTAASLDLLATLHAGGLVVIPATSAGSPWVFHGTLARELAIVHETGQLPLGGQGFMSTQAVLSAVTRDAARIMRIDDEVGTIEIGKRADLLLLAGDPFVDIEQLNAIDVVVRAGTVVPAG